MVAQRFVRWLVLGGALAALGACDAVNERLEQFGQLTNDVLKQISGEDLAPVDPLIAAPLEARALYGVMQAPVEFTPVSLEEAMQTQSFFAVGSVIAMPKEQIIEPVVEPESFDLAAADPAAPDAEPPAPEAAAAAEAARASMAEVEAGAPVVEAAPEPLPAPPPPPPAAAPGGAPSGGAVRPRLAVRSAPLLKSTTPMELREQAQIEAPRALQEAVKDSGVKVTRESLRTARAAAEMQIVANSETAQSVGDEVARKSADPEAPIPRALAVRAKLKVNEALDARQKAYNQLEQLGLSGVVSPEESGLMRITLAVSPTQLGANLDPSRIESMRALFAQQKEAPRCTDDVTAAQMQADPVLATECVVKVLRETGDYVFVEKDYIFSHQMLKKPKSAKPPAGVPNDPLFGLQWHYKANGTGAGQSAGGASFAEFWQRTRQTGSREVTVAVIDTGLQLNHPDIKGSANIAPGFDMVSDPFMGNDGDGRDSNPNDPGDRCDINDPNSSDTFHGTHVAGTIGVASTNNANGVAGGAWDVTIVPVRALGRCGGKLSDINDAIRWAAGTIPARNAQGGEEWNQNPADIINLSIGLFEPCPASMQAAINDAVAAGAIVVAAAGNARVDTKYFAPGGCRNVVSVAANDARGQLTPYSNFGADVTIMAPGGDMTRDDDKDGRPDGVLSTKYSKDCYDPARPETQVEQCYYAYENGTSMAAPHVSAALALIKARFPSALPSDLRTRLLASTNPRTELQCSGKCSNYPGTTPIPGSEGLCFRPCGGAMLNLANAPDE